MSMTSRGNQAQDDAKELLEKQGWLVELAVPQVRVRWNPATNQYERKPSHDFFGCIDLIAVKSDRVRFIQITHPSGVSERLAKIRLMPEKLLRAELLSWEVWSKENGGFTIRLVKPKEVTT